MDQSIDARVLGTHTNYLRAYALRHVRDSDVAQDLVQETLLAALRSTTAFAGRSSLRTWLTGILKHKILDAWRERQRAPVSLDAFAEPGDDGPGVAFPGADPEGAAPDPALELEHKRFREACQRELDRMPVRTAQAFVLTEFAGFTSDEACAQLGVTANALGVMRFRARHALRKALAPAFA